MIVTVTPNPVLDRTLTVPRIEFDEMIRATATRLDWGGKGFNVSRALHALGLDNVAMAFVGGATGQMLEQGLNGLGIATDFVHIASETRTNVVIADATADHYIKVNEAGPTIQPGELAAFLGRVQERARPGDIWTLCGSLPPGLPTDFYAQLIELLRAAGATVFLDTSGEPLRRGCAAGPDLVKPNTIEAQEVSGMAIQSVTEARLAAVAFTGQGVERVALSMGADGLVLASGARAVWARPPQVKARHPTGAGDALLAGIVFAQVQGLALEDMARWGVATGTAAAMQEGVSVGSRAEVEAVYRQTRVVSLDPA